MPKTVIMVFTILGLLSACAAEPQNPAPKTATRANDTSSLKLAEREAVGLLQWLDTADPVADAKRAIAERRPVLLMLGGRGAPIPGVPPEQRARLIAKCPIDILPGATDTVHGDTHLKYLQRAQAYAEQFNRTMLAYCSR
jgi:hypothetical protein